MAPESGGVRGYSTVLLSQPWFWSCAETCLNFRHFMQRVMFHFSAESHEASVQRDPERSIASEVFLNRAWVSLCPTCELPAVDLGLLWSFTCLW